MRSPRLAALELKRFSRGRLPRAAMAAMLLLPLLYGALYLWSFWDPYERLDRIPVALVNEDEGAEAAGKHVDVGGTLVEELHGSGTFDWTETDAEDAEEGVEEGRYYLSLTIPSDFSKRVTSSSGDNPQTGALKVSSNDSSNYVVGQISRTVFSEVRAAASSKASRSFFDNIFVSFSTLHDQTSKAAEGADELHEGIGEAKKGADRLKKGMDDAKDGSSDLRSGVNRLHTGAKKLHTGSKQLSDGTQELADKINGVAGKVRPFLSGHEDDIETVARDVSRTTGVLKQNLDKLPEAADKAQKDARNASDTLSTLHRTRCQEPAEPDAACPQLKQAADAAKTTADVAEDLNGIIGDKNDMDELSSSLDELQGLADGLATRAPHLSEDVDKAVAQVNKLNRGAQKVTSGAKDLKTGLSSARTGASDLDSGLAELVSGAGNLDGGLFKLSDGSDELAVGLHDGAGKIPDHDKEEREDRAGVMADPVDLASAKTHSAPNYGTGFAPYFIPLALWVGAMIAYMLLPPLNNRALAAGAPAWRAAFAGWLPVAAIGAAQAAALLGVLHWGLGLQMERSLGTAGFLLLVTVCFTSVVQFLNARFGPAGRILVLAMLMLQLTSAGGTYPIQTSPEFFNALHPFLPMSHVVEGLRHLITGGELGTVWQACAVLLAFTAGALALTAVTARRKQVWTVDRLHPELAL